MSKVHIICIGCPKGCRMVVEHEGDEIKKISGYGCPIGKNYAREEYINPTRTLTTTVIVKKGELPLVPVKTAQPIPKNKMLEAMKETALIKVKAPINLGQVIVKDIAATGVELVATRSINKIAEKKEKMRLFYK